MSKLFIFQGSAPLKLVVFSDDKTKACRYFYENFSTTIPDTRSSFEFKYDNHEYCALSEDEKDKEALRWGNLRWSNGLSYIFEISVDDIDTV